MAVTIVLQTMDWCEEPINWIDGTVLQAANRNQNDPIIMIGFFYVQGFNFHIFKSLSNNK